MTRKPYDGRERFRAVLKVLLWLCDEMARAGREESDAPRLFVEAGLRWIEDGDTRAITRARKVFDEWQGPIWPVGSDAHDRDAHIRWKWIRAVKESFRWRKELVERARVGANAYEFLLANIVEVLVLMGEPPDASAHRVCRAYSGAVGYDIPESAALRVLDRVSRPATPAIRTVSKVTL